MCDQAEILFYGMNLWNFYDSAISTNSLNFDYYAYNKDERLASPKFKIGIYGKAAEGSKVNLGSSELYRFTYIIKTKILKVIKPALDKMKDDQGYTTGCVYNSGKGKNIYVTLMWSSLSNEAVIRFMIGEKEKTILESDKVYIPIIEFFSFCEILDQAYKGYVTLCSNVIQENSLRKLYDLIESKDFVIPFVSTNNNNIVEEKQDIPSIELTTKIEPSEILEVEDDSKKVIEDISKTTADKDVETQQSNFDDFLKSNRDTFELDIAKPIDVLVKEEQQANAGIITNGVEEIIKTSPFIEKLCEGDLSKLEEIIINSSNEDLPFDSFISTIKKFTNIDFNDGFDSKQYNVLNYVISRQIKTRVNLLIEKQISLPSSTAPVIVKNSKRDNDRLDVTYYLLLLYIYMSKVRTALNDKTKNSIDNKDLFTYLLKMISNPLVFSYLPDTPEDITKSEVMRRYYDLEKSGFFNKFNSDIKSKISNASFTVTKDDIDESITKIYTNINKFKDKLNPGILFDKDFMKLTYNDFLNNELTIDNIKKIIHFDWSLFKYNKVDVSTLNIKNTDDLPVWVLNNYGIKTTKFDTTIIQKYFTDNYKDFDQLEHISKINKNVYDILDSIDLEKFDDKGLRALYFWDTDELPKTMTYLQFKKMIDESSLERGQLVSMIMNKEKVIDPNFFTSFLVSAEDSSL